MRLLFLVLTLFAGLHLHAQGGAPVFIVPTWDELYPLRLPEIPKLPVDGKTAAAQGVKEIVQVETTKTKKKKGKKNTDTLYLWKIDRDGRVISFEDRSEGKSVTKIAYVPVNKLGTWSKRSTGYNWLDSFTVRYNRSGVPSNVIHNYREDGGTNQNWLDDTLDVLYDGKLLPVVFSDDSKTTYAYAYDAEGRLLMRVVTKEGEGLLGKDSIAYSKENGKTKAEHYHRSFTGEPAVYRLIDKVVLDPAGMVLEYEYVFPMGAGNSYRRVDVPGEKASYSYRDGRLIETRVVRGPYVPRIDSSTFDKNGSLLRQELQQIDWSTIKKGTGAMIHYVTERTHDANGLPLTETYRVFKRYGSSSVEDLKAARSYKFVMKK